jgi:hypothetical protein
LNHGRIMVELETFYLSIFNTQNIKGPLRFECFIHVQILGFRVPWPSINVRFSSLFHVFSKFWLYFSNNISWSMCVVTISWHHVITFLHILDCCWEFCVYLCVWHLCIFLDCHLGFCIHLCVCVTSSHFSKLL